MTRQAQFEPKRRIGDKEIRLGKMKPGVYLVLLRTAGRERRGVLLVSDLEATIQRRTKSVRVLVTDRETGRPAAGARVLVASSGRLIGEGRTDARGILVVKGSYGSVSAVAERDGQHALAE